MSLLITIALVLLGVALVVVFFTRGEDEAKAKTRILGIIVVAAVLAVVRIFLNGAAASEELAYDSQPDDAVAKIMADRVAESTDGTRVVILTEVERPSQFQEVQLNSFRERLQELGLEVLGVEPAFPDRVVEEGVFFATTPGVKVGAVESVLSKYSDVEVIMCLAGMPDESVASLGRRMANVDFFAMDTQPSFGWEPAMAAGVLDGAFLPIIDGTWNEEASTDQEIFDNQFVFVTRETYNELRPRFDYDAR